jgi:hypothetical protein
VGKIPVGYENFDIFTPESKNFIIKAFFKKRKRRFVVLVSPLVIIGLIFANSFFVRADLAFYYSPLCLGSWKNVRNIEGEPEVTPSPKELSPSSTVHFDADDDDKLSGFYSSYTLVFLGKPLLFL